MRNSLVLLLCATLVFCSASFVRSASGRDGLELIPSDAAGVLTVESLTRLYATLALDELRVENPAAFARLTEEMIEDVGIDLLDPVAMRHEGFDLDRPFHVGVLTSPAAVVVLIPGEARALAWVRAKLEEQGARFTVEVKYKGTTIEGGDADELACFARDGYVSIVVTDKEDGGGPAVETAKRLVDRSWGKSISQTDLYRKVMDRLPSGSDVKLYAGPGLQARMSNWGKSKQRLAERGMTSDDVSRTYEIMGLDDAAEGMALSLSADRLRMDNYTWVGKNSPMLAWFRVDGDPVSFLRRAPAQPWLIALARINGAKVWATMRSVLQQSSNDSIPSVEDMLADANTRTGVDIETDVIGQINGNAGILVDQVSLMGQQVMLLVQVADPMRFRTTVAKVTEWARAEMASGSEEHPDRPAASIVEDKVGDVGFYRIAAPMVDVCYGVVDDHFVVTTSALRFRELVEGATGFVDGVGNADVTASLATSAAGVLYIDFRGLARDAQGLLPMLGPGGEKYSRLLDELSELVSVTRVDAEGASQNITLTSTTPGIWKRLATLALEAMESQ